MYRVIINLTEYSLYIEYPVDTQSYLYKYRITKYLKNLNLCLRADYMILYINYWDISIKTKLG